jgi:hypothetical protein
MDSKLTADRPLTPAASSVSEFVGSSPIPTPRFFSVTSTSAIVPLVGDYNRDGKVDACDYTEWRSAFGNSASYADGNNDGVVDAADYVFWRRYAMAGLGVALVPEPSGLVMTIAALVFFAWRATPCLHDEHRR